MQARPSPLDNGIRRRIAWLLFVLLAAIYLLTGKGFSEITDCEGYFLITQAMVERGEVSVEPGLTSSALTGHAMTRGGETFLHYGIGYPLVMVPFYVAGKAAGAAAASFDPRLERFGRFFPRAATSTALAFITALTGVAVYYFLIHIGFSLSQAVAGGLLFGLATYAWPYSKIGFYEPWLALCQLLALLWAMVYARTLRPEWLIIGGFMAGWGIAAKPSLVLLVPVLVAYVVWAAWRGESKGRLDRLVYGAVALGAGLAFWAMVMMLYNDARTGAVADMGYSAGNYRAVLTPHHLGEAMFGNTFSTGRGFFVFSPIAILFAFGIPSLWRRARPETLAMLTLIPLNFLVFATRQNWATMRPWGPRYVEPLAPLFAILALAGAVALWPKRWGRILCVTLLIISVGVQVLAISAPYSSWIDRVREETGSGFSAVFRPEYSPLWGQVVLLSEMSLAPVDTTGANVAEGEPTEQFKTQLRRSPDFWAAYMYRLGLPLPLVLGPALVLLLMALMAATMLARVVRREPSGEPGKTD